MGTAMLAAGLVTDFPALVATDMLWGASWNLASWSGIVAWITDELDDPIRITGVPARRGRAQLTGAAFGLAGVGALAAATERSAAMVGAGLAMMCLGGYVALRFPEQRLAHARWNRATASWSAFVRVLAFVRGDSGILVMIGAPPLIKNVAPIMTRMPESPRTNADARTNADHDAVARFHRAWASLCSGKRSATYPPRHIMARPAPTIAALRSVAAASAPTPARPNAAPVSCARPAAHQHAGDTDRVVQLVGDPGDVRSTGEVPGRTPQHLR